MVHVVAGPNNSGKSVLIKGLGLVAYLAHVGSFVPAKSATVGLCDRITCSVASADTLMHAVSTFSTDVAHMSLTLRDLTPRSLLLIDEFGSGTNSYDGVALCAALIRYLAELPASAPARAHTASASASTSASASASASSSASVAAGSGTAGGGSPKVLLTTHFHEMFTLGFLRESPSLRFHTMRYVVRGSISRLEALRSRIEQATAEIFGPAAAAGAGSRGESQSALAFHPTIGGGASGGGGGAAALSALGAGASAGAGANGGRGQPSGVAVVPLFQLSDGWADCSYGISCAMSAGISEPVVERALEVGRALVSQTPLRPVRPELYDRMARGGAGGGGGGGVKPEHASVKTQRDLKPPQLGDENSGAAAANPAWAAGAAGTGATGGGGGDATEYLRANAGVLTAFAKLAPLLLKPGRAVAAATSLSAMGGETAAEAAATGGAGQGGAQGDVLQGVSEFMRVLRTAGGQ